MLATARQALLAAGVADPAQHVVAYRSAWNVRILLSLEPWNAERIAAIRAWCDARSFDVSYYPGIDVAASRAGIYNDLPAVSFDDGAVTSGEGSDDSIADEAGAVLRGQPTPSADAFALAPATLDRPAYYDVLQLTHLGTILRRLEILPQAEIGQLVNLAVLAQAAVIAVVWGAAVVALARDRGAVVPGRLCRVAARDARHLGLALGRARRPGRARLGARVGGARHAVPARAGPPRVGTQAAVRLGGERRVQ